MFQYKYGESYFVHLSWFCVWLSGDSVDTIEISPTVLQAEILLNLWV